GLRVWHKLDRSFLTPRASACFRLQSPGWSSSPAACALTQLALRLVEDSLNEDAYQADVAGLHYSTSPEGRAGVELKVEGFSHRLPLLALRLVRTLAAATFPGAAWGNVHEVLCRKYRNSCMQVDKHANYQRLFALTAGSWHWQEVAAALEEAREEQVAHHVQQALASCHLEVLVTGNMERGEALALAAQAQQAVGGGCSLAGAGRDSDCCLQLPPGKGLRHVQVTRNAEEENCAVEVYFQVGPSGDPVQRALLDLADQVLGEPAYNTLRTQEQLGYTVQLGARLTHGVLGLCGLIVSASHPPLHLEQRLDAFLNAFYDKLQGLSDEEVGRHKAALTANKLQRDRSLAEEAGRHWDAIWSTLYEFFAREAEVAALTSVTRDMLCAWYVEHLLPGSPTRRKLAVHILPAKDCPASGVAAAQPALGTDSADAVNIPDLAAFKATCDRLPVRRGTLPPLAA
ncbi:Metalloenzyme, LuxS/M16 peptidase-like protein, partial [Haematococcus lacustris]